MLLRLFTMRVALLVLIQWGYVFTCYADNAINDSSAADGASIYGSLALLDNHLKYSDQDGATLSIGYCMTHEEGIGTYIARCPDYYQLDGHNTTSNPGYIKLPDNVSELNDYMCGPMNRKGFLCEDCVDGYGTSITGVGYKCSNCSEAWYGVPLYLMIEFIPITIFLAILLIFQINIASPIVSSFILSSQFIVYQLIFTRRYPIDLIVHHSSSNPLFKINLALYGIPTLDFFRRILPPFCVSSSVQHIHAAFLGYVSVLYSASLMFLIWMAIKLHDRGCRILVSLWKPFQRCFTTLRRKINLRNDVIDIFASLIFLSHSKLLYQLSMLFRCTTVTFDSEIDEYKNWTEKVMITDKSINCSYSANYYLLAILPFLSVIVFNILPALLLVLYPFKNFRKLLSKCKLNGLALTTFVEKFHCFYKNGLDGDMDLRSFSGLHFFVILSSSFYPNWSYWTALFLTSALLIAYFKPYKEYYMTVYDTFQFSYGAFLCHLIATGYFNTKHTELYVCALVPALVFGLFLLLKVCLKVKVLYYDRYCTKCYVRTKIETESAVTVKENSNTCSVEVLNSVVTDVREN